MPESIVLLHGFGGTRHAWDGVVAHLDAQRYRPLALDLPGHGGAGAEAQAPVTFDSCMARVLDHAPATFVLAGYSLGGRIALHVALAAPERVQRLVLVSSTAGIEDPGERERRRRADDRLAEELETEPYEQFIERWRAQPLFADEPARVRELALEDQRRNAPAPLARALRGVGTGEMESLWGRLGELQMPVEVVAGSRDEKFLDIARRLAELIPNARLHVLDGGHALALECPRELAAVLEGEAAAG
ncbi:MAG TPA: 2-succinyl-6-hydroxy-2,4-cyclohexadiene-1-carboxylate synthase [Solirubrobacteraceae bacterium]|nr:2-succinyl-6-hydroxy-2,4-cyclohexadiene-1-carboxylate synthase [Solirubrobacteraceae bacterium]